ncbi:PREDICTED: placenta-specific protein 9 [Miniopterus natalensis]|uniref:placenta-specific protein 9 n=1 Tax=Miniopterus natalensis TaxID=291302 RepID=UPI0007A6F464|nr:PREDICTED: placenta-specific protein 9 [Miniopterus natalensis]
MAYHPHSCLKTCQPSGQLNVPLDNPTNTEALQFQEFRIYRDQSTADPLIPSRGDPARSTGCDAHMAVLGRLDVIEEKVEKTVEHLEAEVKGLLSQLEELAWNLPPGPFSPAPDLLGDDHF